MKAHKQSGAVLLVVLVLTAASILVTGVAVEVSMLEMKIKQNYHAKVLALNEAENSLSAVNPILETCLLQSCVNDLTINETDLTNPDWWKTHTRISGEHSYILVRELQREIDEDKKITTIYFQTLNFAQSPDQQAIAVLQTTFEKKFSTDPENKNPFPAKRISWQQLR